MRKKMFQIGSLLSNAAGGFLNSILGPVGAGVGNSISQALFGRQDRLSGRDFRHYQNLMDQGNTREIARQREFLPGIAPAQGQAYNIFQDATFMPDVNRQIAGMEAMNPVQARLDKEYMDTVYAGTSAWERLGSNAAPSLSIPGPSQPNNTRAPTGGDFLGSLAPLVSAGLSSETQLKTATIQSQTQKEIAQMQQTTELAKARMQTAEGQLPHAQARLAAAQEALAVSTTQGQDATTEKTRAETLKTRTETKIAIYDAYMRHTPINVIEHIYGSSTEKQFWREYMTAFAQDLDAAQGTVNGESVWSRMTKDLPPDKWAAVEADVKRAAKLTLTGYEEAITFAGEKLMEYVPKAGKWLGSVVGSNMPKWLR